MRFASDRALSLPLLCAVLLQTMSHCHHHHHHHHQAGQGVGAASFPGAYHTFQQQTYRHVPGRPSGRLIAEDGYHQPSGCRVEDRAWHSRSAPSNHVLHVDATNGHITSIHRPLPVERGQEGGDMFTTFKAESGEGERGWEEGAGGAVCRG